MDTKLVTTPFGRRPMSYAMLTGQSMAQDIEPTRSIDKWKLYRALCEARSRLGISDRTLALLNALLSFYPRQEISAEAGLVVFPSNQQLSLRANGMAEQTIRRHLALLVTVGLITRKDSANGKRYSRRDRNGSLRDAFGFSLAPLLARSSEIEALAQDVIVERLRLQEARESLTICRRDIAKLIAMALNENIPGEWTDHHAAFRSIVDGVPRKAEITSLTTALAKLCALRDAIVNTLDTYAKRVKMSGNPSQNERHIQISESESSLDSEPDRSNEIDGLQIAKSAQSPLTTPTISLSLVLAACPAIADYAPSGEIRSWQDLTSAANVVSRMFQISPSAHQTAYSTMGAVGTAVAVSCILERSQHIRSPGGYLRRLTQQSREGKFSHAQMLMALMKGRERPGLIVMEH